MDIGYKIKDSTVVYPRLIRPTRLGKVDKTLFWEAFVQLKDENDEPVSVIASNLMKENYQNNYTAEINIMHGYEGSNKVKHEIREITSEDVAFVGTKRERNVLTQAIDEVRSRYHTQMSKKQYVLDDEERKVSDDASPKHRPCIKFSPMLLTDYDKGTFKPGGYVQPKYDGSRSYVQFIDGNVVMRSRSHQEQRNNDKFLKPLECLFTAFEDPEAITLDGEVFDFPNSFEKVSGILNAKRALNSDQLKIVKRMKYVIFDMYDCNHPSAIFSERYKVLRAAFGSLDPNDQKEIVLAPIVKIPNEKELFKVRDAFIEYGFEGAVYKPDDAYVMRRSTKALKLKQIKESEFVVTGFTSGKGSNAGCMIWILALEDGTAFKQTHVGTIAEKRKMYKLAQEDFSQFEGRLMTLRYRDLGPNGIPKHVLMTAFRDDV